MTTLLLVLLLATPADAQSRRERREAAAATAVQPEPIAAVEVAPAPAPPQPGSLWSDVSARQLMGLDGNARQVGDLVTVEVDEAQVTALDASTSTARDSSTQLGVGALLGAEQGILSAVPAMGEEISVKGDSKNKFDGTGKTSRSAALAATVTCQVVEVMANGNLRIQGVKTLRVNNESQYLTVAGIARPRDIQMDNTIDSSLLATSIIELTGSGVVADKQRPGLLARIADAIWPF